MAQIVHRKTVDLIPYQGNARTHSPEQIAQIAASIQEFGWTNPILTDDCHVIAGHGRLAAAVSLGMAEVPCLDLVGLSPAQKRAYILADNKLALNAGWDFGLLRAELADLDTGELDMALLGFSGDELEQIATWTPDGLKQGHTDPDEAPAAPSVPVSRTGDIWLLGGHRLLCGDATNAADVGALLAGAKPGLMVTDPPYGVDYDPRWRLESGINKAHQTRAEGRVSNDDRADWRKAWALFGGDVAYVWHGGLHSTTVAASLSAVGFDVRSQIIWAKPSLVIGRGHYHWQHEPCWYAVRKAATGNWSGDRKQSTLWQIQNMHRTQGNVDDGKTNHSTQKPVECMRRPIENNSEPSECVYDPFVGSGTTIIAAEQTSRVCYALEISPAYVDVCVNRWQAFTGKDATLNGDGRTFAEVKDERLEIETA